MPLQIQMLHSLSIACTLPEATPFQVQRGLHQMQRTLLRCCCSAFLAPDLQPVAQQLRCVCRSSKNSSPKRGNLSPPRGNLSPPRGDISPKRDVSPKPSRAGTLRGPFVLSVNSSAFSTLPSAMQTGGAGRAAPLPGVEAFPELAAMEAEFQKSLARGMLPIQKPGIFSWTLTMRQVIEVSCLTLEKDCSDAVERKPSQTLTPTTGNYMLQSRCRVQDALALYAYRYIKAHA